MPIITGIVPSPDRPGHVIILVDGVPFATVPEERAAHFRLEESGDERAAEPSAFPAVTSAAAQKTYERALNLLALRARSAAELKKRLKEKGEPLEQIEAAIERLKKNGLLDDARYAEAKARGGIVGKARSPRRMQHDLAQRGVSRAVADEAIRRAFDEAGTDETAVAERAARKKLRTLAGHDPLDQRRKLYAYLARQAYAPDVVRKVMHRVLDAPPPDEGDE